MTSDRDQRRAPPPVDPDSYAARYMPGAGRVLLRDKAVGKKLVLILGAATLWVAAGAVATFLGVLPKANVGIAVLLTVMAAFFALLTATLTVVRVVVSEGEVYVQYGLWGPRVPVARIRNCRVTAYDWKKFGGWGIKRAADGTWAYVMTAGGDVVEMCWADEKDIERTVLFSASDPRAVVAAIEQARASSGARVAETEQAAQRISEAKGAEPDEPSESSSREPTEKRRG